MDIKNMTVGQIADMDVKEFSSLTFDEAKAALAILRRSVNQRIRRLNAADVYSPAVQAVGSLRPQKGLSRAQTLAEVRKGIQFLNDKTSTIKGARAVQRQVLENLGLRPDTTKEEAAEAYRIFNRLKEEYPAKLSEAAGGLQYGSLKQRVGSAIQEGLSFEDLSAAMRRSYEEGVDAAEAIEEAITANMFNLGGSYTIV